MDIQTIVNKSSIILVTVRLPLHHKSWINKGGNSDCMYACMHVCMHACIYACMHVCMYVCMHVYLYVCMYVCVYASIYLYIYVYVQEYITFIEQLFIIKKSLRNIAIEFELNIHRFISNNCFLWYMWYISVSKVLCLLKSVVSFVHCNRKNPFY